MGEERREITVDRLVPLVGGDNLARSAGPRRLDRVERRGEHRQAALYTYACKQPRKAGGPETQRQRGARLQDQVGAARDQVLDLRLDGGDRALDVTGLERGERKRDRDHHE